MPDYAAVAAAIKPIRGQGNAVMKTAKAFGTDDVTFFEWMRVARELGYDTGEPRDKGTGRGNSS